MSVDLEACRIAKEKVRKIAADFDIYAQQKIKEIEEIRKKWNDVLAVIRKK